MTKREKRNEESDGNVLRERRHIILPKESAVMQITTLVISSLCVIGSQAWVPHLARSRVLTCLGSSSSASDEEQKTQVNNVVLTPGEDPSSFDSFKIGNPRVHRYAPDRDPERTEYGKCGTYVLSLLE